MLDSRKISDVTEEVVRESVSGFALERVLAEPTSDSEGKDALSITVVLTPEALQGLTGDQVLDLLVALQQRLRAEGEERSPVIQYASEQELESDTQSEEPELVDDEG